MFGYLMLCFNRRIQWLQNLPLRSVQVPCPLARLAEKYVAAIVPITSRWFFKPNSLEPPRICWNAFPITVNWAISWCLALATFVWTRALSLAFVIIFIFASINTLTLNLCLCSLFVRKLLNIDEWCIDPVVRLNSSSNLLTAVHSVIMFNTDHWCECCVCLLRRVWYDIACQTREWVIL